MAQIADKHAIDAERLIKTWPIIKETTLTRVVSFIVFLVTQVHTQLSRYHKTIQSVHHIKTDIYL